MHEVCIPHRIPRAWKQQETATGIMQKSSKKSGRKERRHEGEKSQTRPS